jgi:5-methylcytosine-specific restriction endonuclease McrA
MRNLSSRPPLTSTALKRLKSKTDEIAQITDPQERKERARVLYDSARKSQWFQPLISALRSLCGEGALCMYCSSNEPSQVEHYRPLSVFPERALEYENYLWSCDICNRTKGDRFPPDTEPGERLLNPLDENVWDYFFLDEHFGRLVKRLDPITKTPLPRSVSTCEVVGIDRENVQHKRLKRFKRLRQNIQDALDKFRAEIFTQEQLRDEIAALREEPFQADVADYFLNGPGRVQEPFHSALLAAGEPEETLVSLRRGRV